MQLTFKPAAENFPESKVVRTVDIKINPDSFTKCEVYVDGKAIPRSVIAHGVAFALKQRLANSTTNAATAKDDKGNILPQADREKLWAAQFDKVLDKIVTGSADWTTVITGARESLSPFESACRDLSIARLERSAKAQGKTLPKRSDAKFGALVDQVRNGPAKAEIEKAAKAMVAAAESVTKVEDDDIDLSGL